MRWRLIAIITVPTVTALILGVIQIVGSVNNYSSFKRVQDLANLNSLVVNAAGQLADERDDTAGFVAAGGQAFLNTQISQLVGAISQIQSAGAKTILIDSLQGNTGYAAYFNQTFKNSLDAAGVNYVYVDVYNLLDTIRANPALYGLDPLRLAPGVAGAGAATTSACVAEIGRAHV